MHMHSRVHQTMHQTIQCIKQFRVASASNSMHNSSPETWPHTKIPSVAAKPNAKFTVRNIPCEPSLRTS